jgi:hypothetical protein
METSDTPHEPDLAGSDCAPEGLVPDDFELNREYYLHGGHKKHPQKGRWIPAGVAEREPTQEEIAAMNG